MLRNRNRPGCRNAVVLLAMSALLLSGCAEEFQPEVLLQEDFMTAPEVKYETATVEKGSYEQVTKDKLSIVYTKKENLSWDKDNARFEEVFVRTNQEVKAGDILMSFKVEVSQAELAALRLRLQRAREDVESGSASREQKIHEAKEAARYMGYHEGKIALLQIEKMQVEYEQFLYQTQREILQLEQKVADMEAEMENNVLCAPFDGVISYVADWMIGGKVPAGQILITIYSPDAFLLQCGKNPDLLYNMPVTVETNNTEEVFAGRVISAPNILPSSLNQSGVMIRLDEEIAAKTFGRNIKVSAQTQALQNVLTVSSSAIRQESGKSYVYVLEEGLLRKRYVEIGADSSETAWILDGLSEGTIVITALEG